MCDFSYRHLKVLIEEKGLSVDVISFDDDTVDDIFNQGNGRITELFAEWLTALRVGADDLENEHVQTFLVNCSLYFPRCLQTQYLECHLTWECFRQWTKDRVRMDLLRGGVSALKAMERSLSPPLVNALALLSWKTFLAKAARDAVTAIEYPSPRRCLRDVGVPEADLADMLELAAIVAQIGE